MAQLADARPPTGMAAKDRIDYFKAHEAALERIKAFFPPDEPE